MFVYLSDFTSIQNFPPPHAPTIIAIALNEANAEHISGAIADLRTDSTSTTGHCLVGLNGQLATVPSGVTFLFNSDTDLDSTVSQQTRNLINAQLGVSIPAGLTWRQLLIRLFKVDGAGKWGVIVGNMQNLFGGINL